MITKKYTKHVGLFRGNLDIETMQVIKDVSTGSMCYKDYNIPTVKSPYTPYCGYMVDIEDLRLYWADLGEGVVNRSTMNAIEQFIEECEEQFVEIAIVPNRE